MPNFHDDVFAVAARSDDMLEVLRAFALNLSQHPDETEIDYEGCLACETPPELFNLIRPALGDFYELAFPSADGSDEGALDSDALANHPAAAQVAALASALGSSGVKVSIGVAPAGRGVSDTAVVQLRRFGDTFVFTMWYATARVSNIGSVSRLFEQLPEGTYGVAYVDGDEGDGYDEVSVVAGTHHGSAPIDDVDPTPHDIGFAEDLFVYLESRSDIDVSRERDLGKIALIACATEWTDYDSALEPDDDGVDAWTYWDRRVRKASPLCEDPDDDEYYEDEGEWEGRNRSIECLFSGCEVTDAERAEARASLREAIERFPFECEVTGQAYLDRNEHIEHLVPDSAVLLRTTWVNAYLPYVDIGLYDEAGRTLGNLGGYMNPTADMRLVIACLLPHIRAYAYDVEPLKATTNRRRRIGKLVVHLELEPFDFDEACREMFEIASQDPSQRVRESVLAVRS